MFGIYRSILLILKILQSCQEILIKRDKGTINDQRNTIYAKKMAPRWNSWAVVDIISARKRYRIVIICCSGYAGLEAPSRNLPWRAFASALTLAMLLLVSQGSGQAAPPAPGPVYVGPGLSPGFGMGGNTGKGKQDWFQDVNGIMKCSYPAGQGWGTVFITAGPPDTDVAKRLTVDESRYKYLTVDVKGAHGGETINVGVKTKTDPDNGQEPTYMIDKLTTNWQTFKIPLSKLEKSGYPASRFKHLYVACEIVFSEEAPAETISFRNVAFTN